jgi:hypothetical protein
MICHLCGSKQNIEVGHVNGFEEDTEAANLIYTCRSCNVFCANTLGKAGLGRRTRQYNPPTQGAKTLAQWLTAVMSMKGDSDAMPVESAVAMIRATSPSRRSEFASEIWSLRKARGN